MIVALLLVALSVPQEADQELRRLIDQLGDASVQVRDQASRRLIDLGEDAMPALRGQASLVNADAELRARAAAVLETIQWKLAEKKFEGRVGAKGKKWDRLLDETIVKCGSTFRIYAEQADETSWPTVAAVARDGTITEAQGIGVVDTLLPLVFGKSKAAGDQERREIREACMGVLKRSLPLKSGITVELGLLGFVPERADRDDRGGLRAGFSVNYPAWGPHVDVTLVFGGEGRPSSLARSAWSLEWVYEKEETRLRAAARSR
jgi:hypothetical protein